MQNTPRHVGIQKPVTYQSGLTVKSLLLALVLIPFNVWWLIELEVVRVGYPTIIHPQANVIFIIFLAPLDWVCPSQTLTTAWYFSAGTTNGPFHAVYCLLSLFVGYAADFNANYELSVSICHP